MQKKLAYEYYLFFFRRFWVNEPRRSENQIAKKRYTSFVERADYSTHRTKQPGLLDWLTAIFRSSSTASACKAHASVALPRAACSRHDKDALVVCSVAVRRPPKWLIIEAGRLGPVDPAISRGVADLCPFTRVYTPQQHARSKQYHTQLANMSFDEIFDLTGGSFFFFFFFFFWYIFWENKPVLA